MFKNIKKVNENGVKIRGSFKKWRKLHPNALVFDSFIEWRVWKYLKLNKINFVFQPQVELVPGIYTNELKRNEIKETKQRKMSYTPDFYLVDEEVYIEVKGWATPEFRLRWKLFKLKGYEGYIVRTLDELNVVLNFINYDTSKYKLPRSS